MADEYGLYLVTDSEMVGGWQQVAPVVAQAIEGGVSTVQVRDKHLDDAHFAQLVSAVLAVTEPAGVPLIVNDRVEVAAKFGLDAHIGQGDMPLAQAREILGAKPRIGLSVGSQAELDAVLASDTKPDLLGLGPVFATATKKDAGPPLGLEGLASLARQAAEAGIASVAIGGINRENIAEVSKTAVNECCVVSAIMAAPDPKRAAAELKELMS